jgi:hypothetical protein
VSRKRLRLALDELGRITARGTRAWVWRCLVMPCPTDTQRREPQLTEDAAAECLVAHLRDYHGATGGERRGQAQTANSPRQRRSQRGLNTT